jgi:hypothetical protein
MNDPSSGSSLDRFLDNRCPYLFLGTFSPNCGTEDTRCFVVSVRCSRRISFGCYLSSGVMREGGLLIAHCWAFVLGWSFY